MLVRGPSDPHPTGTYPIKQVCRCLKVSASDGQTARVEVTAVTVPTMTEIARSAKQLA